MHRGLILRLFVLLTDVSRPVSTPFGHGFFVFTFSLLFGCATSETGSSYE